jgi:hypothetical protein
VGDAVVAKTGSKSYKGKVIKLPHSMEEKRGAKCTRKLKQAMVQTRLQQARVQRRPKLQGGKPNPSMIFWVFR